MLCLLVIFQFRVILIYNISILYNFNMYFIQYIMFKYFREFNIDIIVCILQEKNKNSSIFEKIEFKKFIIKYTWI